MKPTQPLRAEQRPERIEEGLPDARDGLTRVERVVLCQLEQLSRERAGRSVPTVQLYGRVLEHVDLSLEALQDILSRLAGGGKPDES